MAATTQRMPLASSLPLPPGFSDGPSALITASLPGHRLGDRVRVGQLPGPHRQVRVLNFQLARGADQGNDLMPGGQGLARRRAGRSCRCRRER
jgi:hypothetical protein